MSQPASPRSGAGNPFRIREPLASSLTEIWMVSAVVTILGIRGYLAATGYPQVGGSSLHIAHMLWGGLGMVVGFGILAIFAHPVWKPIATVISGAGFGCFIDELGKFITNDNDYFYRPTIALIYAVFLVFFLLARYFVRKREPTRADHLYLALQGVQWLAIGKLDAHRQRIALDHLDASGDRSALAGQLREMLLSAELVGNTDQSRILAARDRMVEWYWRIIRNHWLERIVIGAFLLKGVAVVIPLVVIVAVEVFGLGEGLTFVEWGSIGATLAGGVLAALGAVLLLRGHRVVALKAFAASVLCSLLFGQVFAFATSQFYAIVNVGFDLVMLGVVQFALSVETEPAAGDHEIATHEHPAPVGMGQVG